MHRFKCPKCGSHKFGSSIINTEIIGRTCHGSGCKFSWSIGDDDKYFHKTEDELLAEIKAEQHKIQDEV